MPKLGFEDVQKKCANIYYVYIDSMGNKHFGAVD